MSLGTLEAIDLVKRLTGLRGYPREKEAQNELTKAMLTAPSMQRATEFIDDTLRTATTCPYPSDLYTAFRRAAPERRTACQWCDGTGLESVYELITFEHAATYKIKFAEGRECREVIGNVNELASTNFDMNAYRRALPDNQDVRQISRRCPCKG